MATAAPPSHRERGAAKRPPRRIVYVFELPVRIVHWTIVVAIIVLSFTGYYIHHPFLSGSGMPGHLGFTMGEMRFIHESVGFVFIAAVIFRIYWCFVGNEYVRWSALFPITKKQRQDMKHTLQFYFYFRRDPARLNGHNPLAGLAYVTPVPRLHRHGADRPGSVRVGDPHVAVDDSVRVDHELSCQSPRCGCCTSC